MSFLTRPIGFYFLAHAILLIIGALVVQLSYTWAAPVGIGLMTAAISGSIVGLYVATTHNTTELLETLRTLGFERAWMGRGPRIRQEYEEHLSNLSRNFDVLGFGLRQFREDFGAELGKWSQNANVRILLLDPEFPVPDYSYAGQRDKEENNATGTISTDVKAFAREVGDIISGENSNLEVRLYQCLPSINIFRIDEHMFWGPYLINDQSRNMPTIKIKSGSILFQSYIEHFDLIWDNHSRQVPQEWMIAEQ